jgi:hypothetical protein
VRPWARAEVWLATRPASIVRSDGDGFLKRRTPLGSLAVLSTAIHATRFVVLPEREWFDREAWLYRSLYGLEVEVRGSGALWLPRLPGERLDHAIRTCGDSEALALAGSALATLAALHAAWPFSHADATARNALFDAAEGQVRFFDFETIHPASFSPAARLADDLATLAGSVAHALGPSVDAALAGALLGEYGDLRGEILEAASARDLASRARVPMSDARHRAWVAALRASPPRLSAAR